MLPTIVTVNPFMKSRKKHRHHSGRVSNRLGKSRRRHSHRVENPFNARKLTGSIVPAVIGAAGAIGTDVAMAYLPLPTQLQSGALNLLARAAVAIGVGYIAGIAVNKNVGREVAAGGLIVVAYSGLKQALAPTLGQSMKGLSGLADFGDYTPAYSYSTNGAVGAGLGAYMRNPGMGAYMQPRLGAYMHPGSIVRGSPVQAKQMAGFGGFGGWDFQANEGSMM